MRLEGEIAAAEAEDQVYEEEEAAPVQGTSSQGQLMTDEVPGTSRDVERKKPSHCGQPIEATKGRNPDQLEKQTRTSEVSLGTPRQRRLPEVPTNLPSTLPVPAKRSSQWQAVQAHERWEDAKAHSAAVTRKPLLDAGDKVRHWGIHVPSDQTLPAADPVSTSSRSTEGLVTEDRLLQLVGALQSPRVVMELFDGDPAQYPAFIRAFEESVENVMLSSRARLTRLTQLCTGKAAMALQGCAMMSSEAGYKRAREILKERFGKPARISQLIIKRLLEERQTSDLHTYADKLEGAYMSLREVGAAAELDTQGVLKPLVKGLSRNLRQKWRTRVYVIEETEERKAVLKDLVDLLRRVAATEDHPVYGEDSEEEENEVQISSRIPGRSRSAFATRASSACPVCGATDHMAAGCSKFAALRPEERLREAIQLRLCFVCLEPGHITRDCQHKQRCQAAGCGRMHASLLHGADFKSPHRVNRETRSSPATSSSHDEIASPFDVRERCERLGTSYYIQGSKVALPLVQVTVSSPESGRSVHTHALLDSGSNVTLCDEQLLEDLGVTGRKEALSLTTLERVDSKASTRVVSLTIQGTDRGRTIHLPRVFSRQSLNLKTNSMVTKGEVNQWPHLRDLPIPQARASDVRLLIGQDCPQRWLHSPWHWGRKENRLQ